VNKYYITLEENILREIEGVSEEIEHSGEQGRNNEAILMTFLKKHLPLRYGLTTGKVVSADGEKSRQIDIIIYDQINSPKLQESHVWSMVPVESVYGVISVKTTLDKTSLKECANNIESVRRLKRNAAVLYEAGLPLKIDEKSVLRPRAFIFGYKSKWKNIVSMKKALTDILKDIDDKYRPNGLCALNRGLLARIPYTLETNAFSEDVLMNFYLFMLSIMDSFGMWRVDLSKYIKDFEQKS